MNATTIPLILESPSGLWIFLLMRIFGEVSSWGAKLDVVLKRMTGADKNLERLRHRGRSANESVYLFGFSGLGKFFFLGDRFVSPEIFPCGEEFRSIRWVAFRIWKRRLGNGASNIPNRFECLCNFFSRNLRKNVFVPFEFHSYDSSKLFALPSVPKTKARRSDT